MTLSTLRGGVAAWLAVTGCIFTSGGSNGSGGSDGADTSGTAGSSDDAGPVTAASANSGGADETGGAMQCYGDTTAGCTSLSWSTIVGIIDAIYLFQNSYYGYSKAEALALAEQLYDEGVVPGEWLRVVTLQDLGDGRWRAHVAVASPDGHPDPSVATGAFTVALDGGEAVAPAAAYVLGDADPGEVHLELSVVIDDSGSIADCDANFVIAGVSHLFETIPPVYSASLVKFADDVSMAQARTDDADALANAMRTYCTDRGSTSLWDAIAMGLDDLPDSDGMRAVMVFTDGLDNDSTATLDDVVDAAKAGGVPVFVIGLGLADMFALSTLAIDTGGALVYIPSGKQGLTAFELVTGFVSDSYVVEFEAPAGFDSVRVAATLAGGETVSDAAGPPG
jgi:hypothetical protein